MQLAENNPDCELAEAIVRYLSHHPKASDSVHGIATWWLGRQRYDDTVERVEHALHELERRGVVIKVRLGNGHVIYRPGPTVSLVDKPSH